MKCKLFLWFAVMLGLPVSLFYLSGTATAVFILLVFAAFIYFVKIRKVKLELALTIALALLFVTFLVVNLFARGSTTLFLNTRAFDMGMVQAIFLKPTKWLAGLGLYSLFAYFLYNYQRSVRPNLLIIMIPFVTLLVLVLMSLSNSASFIVDYWRQA